MTIKNKETVWNAQRYNQDYSFVFDYGESLIKLLDPQPNERILDLGCGTGQLTSKIQQLCSQTIGLDKSPEMIAQAKRDYPHINFLVADGENFQFDEEFDKIFSNATLHWIKDYKGVISSMYSNLKTDGKIVIEMGGKGNLENILSPLRNSLTKRGYVKQAKTNVWFFPSLGEYATLLEETGFEVVFAQQFDRPTELESPDVGIKDWLTMFAMEFFDQIADKNVEEIKNEVQTKAKSKCLINGKLYADYKRLRIVAVKHKVN